MLAPCSARAQIVADGVQSEDMYMVVSGSVRVEKASRGELPRSRVPGARYSCPFILLDAFRRHGSTRVLAESHGKVRGALRAKVVELLGLPLAHHERFVQSGEKVVLGRDVRVALHEGIHGSCRQALTFTGSGSGGV